MNLLVTGGAGFLGSGFVRKVLADAYEGLHGARVTVLDKLTDASTFANLGPVAESPRLNFVPGDAGDQALVDVVLPGHDAVVHVAPLTPVMLGPDPDHPVRGHQSGRGPARAGVPPHPRAAGRGDPGRNHLRSAPAPAQPVAGAVTNLLSGRMVPLPGEGQQVRDWVNVDDHCRGVALALLEGEAGAVHHIGGQELTNRELTGIVQQACGAGPDRVVPVDEPPGYDRRQALDDERIRHELGYRPQVTVSEGLAATVQWYRDNEDWWRRLLPD